ncbi:MAG: 50S ribosomal protein L4 [Minisyncoccales bacterium]
MKINLYNQKGEKVGKTDLPDEIFNVEINSDLLHQVIVSQMANKRQSSAHTKDRGDVSGGGKKPWRQKGTGRARHGSRRSPIWVGGGVTFGPKSEKNYKKTIPQKMKRKALFMALSSKVNDDELILIDDLGMKEPQARIAQSILEKLPLSDKSGLVVLSEPDKNIVLSFRNIPKTESIQAKDLTALNILSFKKLIMTPDSVVKIKETFLKDNSSKA